MPVAGRLSCEQAFPSVSRGRDSGHTPQWDRRGPAAQPRAQVGGPRPAPAGGSARASEQRPEALAAISDSCHRSLDGTVLSGPRIVPSQLATFQSQGRGPAPMESPAVLVSRGGRPKQRAAHGLGAPDVYSCTILEAEVRGQVRTGTLRGRGPQLLQLL